MTLGKSLNFLWISIFYFKIKILCASQNFYSRVYWILHKRKNTIKIVSVNTLLKTKSKIPVKKKKKKQPYQPSLSTTLSNSYSYINWNWAMRKSMIDEKSLRWNLALVERKSMTQRHAKRYPTKEERIILSHSGWLLFCFYWKFSKSSTNFH